MARSERCTCTHDEHADNRPRDPRETVSEKQFVKRIFVNIMLNLRLVIRRSEDSNSNSRNVGRIERNKK